VKAPKIQWGDVDERYSCVGRIGGLIVCELRQYSLDESSWGVQHFMFTPDSYNHYGTLDSIKKQMQSHFSGWHKRHLPYFTGVPNEST
jgi:hypothetical protein